MQREARSPNFECYLNGKNNTHATSGEIPMGSSGNLASEAKPKVFLNFTWESCYIADSDSEVLGWGPRSCISNKLPNDALQTIL